MLVGAFARDVWFWHIHGVETQRATEDIDISMEFPDWPSFSRFGDVLLGMGFTRPVPGHPEKFLDPQSGQKLDLLPFGRLSDDGRSIVWPTDHGPWSILGFEESYSGAVILAIKESPHRIRMATLPGMILLKLISFYERTIDRKRKDGADIGFTLENYLASGNTGRLENGPDADIMDAVGGDIQRAVVVLLGRDMGRLAQAATRDEIVNNLKQEVESPSRCPLARELCRNVADGKFPRARELINDLLTGMSEGGLL